MSATGNIGVHAYEGKIEDRAFSEKVFKISTLIRAFQDFKEMSVSTGADLSMCCLAQIGVCFE